MAFNPRNRASSIPCPNCKRLVSLQAPRCIHCGLRRPGLYARAPILNDLLRGDLSFVNGILIACLALYATAILLDLSGALGGGLTLSNPLALLSPSNLSLFKLGMGGGIPWLFGRWWTLLTATYLHGSVLHILFNLLWLRRIGPWVEELFGASRFFIIYTLAGLAGSVLSTIMGTHLFVGASGAIFGLFGALIYYGWKRGGTFGSALFRQMLIWSIIGMAVGFLMPNVDNWGHAGGFLGGFLIAALLGYEEKRRQRLVEHIAAALLLVFVIVCFGMMFIYFFQT